MTKLSTEWAIFSVILIAIMLTAASISADLVLAVKKGSSSSSSSSSSVKTVHKAHGSTTTTTTTATAVRHVKGVKVFHVHTVPSKVVVGTTFGLKGVVFNNSTTATITFANGTCSSPLSITFNKNVLTEPQAATAPCKAQQVTLKPGEQSFILSPNLSGSIYRATAPGITNATMTLKYGAVIGTGKSPISDSITRMYTFNILPTGSTSSATSSATSSHPATSSATNSHPATSSHKRSSGPTLQPGVLQPVP
jgi:hypothetical protein